MPSADQVPVKSTHSMMPWPKWVVLIAGSTSAALRAVRPTVTSDRSVRRDRLCRERDGLPVAFTPGHHSPRHPGNLVGERDRSNLGGAARQQSRKPRPMSRAMDLGIADHGERAGSEQAAQVAIALFAYAAKLVLASARVLLRHEPDPGREVPTRSESLGVSNARDQSCRQRRTDAGDRVKLLTRRI